MKRISLKNLIYTFANLRLNVKIALLGAGSVVITASTLVGLSIWQSNQYNALGQNEVNELINADLDHITQGIYNLIKIENEAVQQQVDYNLNVAAYILENAGGINISDKTVHWDAVNQFTGAKLKFLLPAVYCGKKWLGKNSDPLINTPVTDEITKLVGDTATIFQRINKKGDMLRVATNVKNAEGKRAIGTYIPVINPDGNSNPVMKAVLSNKRYHGIAYVVNQWYLTAYEPIISKSGSRIIGMLYVGVKQQVMESRIRNAIIEIMVGKTGYVYIIKGSGEEQGHYVISYKGERDGENILDNRDSDGRYVIREIINKALVLQPGEMATVRYRWQNPGELIPRWKIARIAYYKPWDWVIGVSAYEDELQAYLAVFDKGRLHMTVIMSAAGFIITILMGFAGTYIAFFIASPVIQMKKAAEKIINGNLNTFIDEKSGDEVGQLAHAFNQMTDKLNSTMEGLQKSEEKYREIFENAMEGLFQTTFEGKFLNANLAMSRILGYSSPEELMNEVTDIRAQLYTNPKDRDFVIGEITEKGFVSGMEIPVFRKDREEIWISLSVHVVADKKGLPLFIEGSINDITERKISEKKISEANDRFRSLLRASTAYSIISTAPSGIIKIFNEGAERMLGYMAEEMIDKETILLFHDPEEIKAKAESIKVFPDFNVFIYYAHQGKTDIGEWTYIHKNGSRFSVSLTLSEMFNESGDTKGYIIIARDITLEKKLEHQLLHSQKMDSLGMLAGGIAHDFNNLLTPIIGYSELLIKTFSENDPALLKVNHILQAADRAKDLTQRLLAFGRKQIIELKTVDLGEITNHFAGILRRTIRESIQLEIKIASNTSLIKADAGQIEQVIVNLAINAQDAMKDGGLLVIEVDETELDESYTGNHPEITPGKYVVLSFSDTGIGIDKNTLEHIFDPFFTTKELGKGTGLGLSTVYGIVNQHGGSITVYSEKNHGTVFKIFFPKADNEALSDDSTPRISDGFAYGNETILLTEDDEQVRTITGSMLENLGYKVLTAENPDKAIELFKSNHDTISMLLTDVIMPGMNGRELYMTLHNIHPGLKVLFMSGYANDEIGKQGILEKGLNFIQKPFSLNAISKKIRNIIES